MTVVAVEIMNAELALEVLAKLDPITLGGQVGPDDETCHRWLDDLTLKIQAALLHKAENTWKHLSSFDTYDVYPEINEFGDIRVNDTIYKPEPYEHSSWDGWAVCFPDNNGHKHWIDPIHFVKVHFHKDLEL